MPYVTRIAKERTISDVSFDEIMFEEVSWERLNRVEERIPHTRTHLFKDIPQEIKASFHKDEVIDKIISFNQKYEDLFDKKREELYEHFFIPKRSGGLRRIDAPKQRLMEALKEFKCILEVDMVALYHTSSFAYTKGRGTLNAVQKHQQNKSNWFLKTDFSDFFGSTNFVFLFDMIKQIFPFSEILEDDLGTREFKRALDLCFLNNGLPQGTPTSPILTNLMMIPIDFHLSNNLRKMEGKFVYTRYADDILISSKERFNHEGIVKFILDTLKKFKAPFKIKAEKTRYQSIAGRNINLGLVLNKDNKITIGHQKKKQFKAMCTNYILDTKNNKKWELGDVQEFAGIISYYKMIEKDAIEGIISHYNSKFQTNIMELIKRDIKGV